MSETLVRHVQPLADVLICAVASRDVRASRELLATATRKELEALAVVLADRLPTPKRNNADALAEAARVSADAFGTTELAILNGGRTREDCDARAVVCYVGRLLGLTYSFMGRELGRDHSTVMAACSRAGETPRLRRIAQRIAGELGWNRELELALDDDGEAAS